MKKFFLLITLIFQAISLPIPTASAAELNADAISRDIAALTAGGHRLAGSPQGRAAGDYILAQLKNAGYDDVIVQKFPVTQMVMEPGDCYAQIGERKMTLQPLRPNGLALPVTPERGITGPAIYLGDGDQKKINQACANNRANGKALQDAIVVLDYASNDAWLRAVELGAAAIIFVGPMDDARNTPKWLNCHANIPRFYLERNTAQDVGILDVKTQSVTLHSRLQYRRCEARNIIVKITGKESSSNMLALAAEYDTFGVMPWNCPSPEKAGNIAALLEIARRCKQAPPAQSRLLIFFDNNAQDQLGQLFFFHARQRFADHNDPQSIASLLEGADAQRLILDASLKVPADVDALVQSSGNGHQGVRIWGPTLVLYTLGAAWIGLTFWVLIALWQRTGDATVIVTVAPRNTDEENHGKSSAKPIGWLWPTVAWITVGVIWFLCIGTFNTQASGASSIHNNVVAAEREEILLSLRREYDHLVEQLANLRLQSRALKETTLRTELSQSLAKADADENEMLAGRQGDLQRWSVAAKKQEQQEQPKIEAQLTAGAEQLRELGAIRIDAIHGQLHEQSRALFEKLVERHRHELLERREENVLCQQQLQSSQALAQQLAEVKLQAMVFVSLTASDFSWAVDVPSSAASSRFLANPPLARAIEKSLASDETQKLCPSLAGSFSGMNSPAPQIWSVAAQAGFVLHLLDADNRWSMESLHGQRVADVKSLVKKYQEALALIDVIAAMPELGASTPPTRTARFTFNFPQWDSRSMSYQGCSVRSYSGGTIDADIPVHDATVAWTARYPAMSRDVPADRLGMRLATTGGSGDFALLTDEDRVINIVAVRCQNTGEIEGITQLCPGAPQATASDWNHVGYFGTFVDSRLTMFQAQSMLLTNMAANAFVDLPGTRMLRGSNESEFDRVNLTVDQGFAALYADNLREIKIVSANQLLLDNWPGNPRGVGYPNDGRAVDIRERSALDAWILNDSRLTKLRKHGVSQEALERLHDRAVTWIERARESVSGDPLLARAQMACAQAYAMTVLTPVRQVTTDMIHAVVILLLLAVPFAWALERVAIGTANIYRQVAGFGIIFLVVFVILYLVHPAFAFTSFPIVVLLAFLIIVMSCLVIAIMWGKFESEVKRMQGLAIASHTSTRNVRATMAAAFTQGVASMRRRPLRTTLTAITIVLLTFTVMFFGSLSASGGFSHVVLGPADASSRVEIQLSGAALLNAAKIRTIEQIAGPQVQIVTHQMPANSATFSGDIPLLTEAGRLIACKAWITICAEDLQFYPGLAQSITGDMDRFFSEGGILVPSLAPQTPPVGTQVQFLDRAWKVRGTFDPKKLSAITSASGLRLIPPDVTEMRRLLELQNPNDPEGVRRLLEQTQTSAYPVIEPQALVLICVPKHTLAADVSSLILKPQNAEQAKELAHDLTIFLQNPVGLIADGRAERVLYSTQLQVSGLTTLLAPLILGGLIIFGTMLSSVNDREREIYTLAALGLSPVHVGVLFFAEALVYSVLGGLAGYLTGQGVSRLADVFSQWGWVTAPPVNASSSGAMLSILLVMATVMLSTIYPAYKASRSANPGIQRSWRLPKATGDELAFEFPFTVSAYDAIGLMGFLEEYLTAHRDRSVGAFAAGDVQVKYENERFTLSSKIWLQPFDQGVSQMFILTTEPSDIQGVDRVMLSMGRLAGPPAVWSRGNAVFVNELRNQFIFWRTIDEQATEHYHQINAQRFGIVEVPGVSA